MVNFNLYKTNYFNIQFVIYRYDTDSDFETFADRYRELYVRVIKPIVEEIDNSREYLSSSPSNGKQVEEENWISKLPQSEFYGDSTCECEFILNFIIKLFYLF